MLDTELVALELAVFDIVELPVIDAVLVAESETDVVCVLVPVRVSELDPVELPVVNTDVLPEVVPEVE